MLSTIVSSQSFIMRFYDNRSPLFNILEQDVKFKTTS